MIREGFSRRPLVWLYVWTGSGEDVKKERLPEPVTVRRYSYGERRKAEARLIPLILSKVIPDPENDGGLGADESYERYAPLPVFCHFIMAQSPNWWIRFRRMLGLSDYSARRMRRLLGELRLDIRSTLNVITRFTVGPHFTEYERGVLENVLKEEKHVPNRREIKHEADFYYGLLANLGIRPNEAQQMTAWDITQLCNAAGRQSKKGGHLGFDEIQRRMGHARR